MKTGKCPMGVILVKNHKKGFVFVVAKTLKGTTTYSLKLAKVFSQHPIPFKVNVSLYSNVSQYSGVKKLAFPLKQMKKTL